METTKNLLEVLSNDFLNADLLKESDPEKMKLKLNHIQKDHKNFTIQSTDWKKCINVKFEINPHLQNNPDVWIPQKINLIKEKNYFLVGKTSTGLHDMIALYLRRKGTLKKVSFINKTLWKLFQKIKTYSSEKISEIILHRIILKNSFIESSKINELNIQTKNVEDVDGLGDMINICSEIKAITIRFYFFDDKSHITIRIDKSGHVLIYGNPPIKHQEWVIQALTTAIDDI